MRRFFKSKKKEEPEPQPDSVSSIVFVGLYEYEPQLPGSSNGQTVIYPVVLYGLCKGDASIEALQRPVQYAGTPQDQLSWNTNISMAHRFALELTSDMDDYGSRTNPATNPFDEETFRTTIVTSAKDANERAVQRDDGSHCTVHQIKSRGPLELQKEIQSLIDKGAQFGRTPYNFPVLHHSGASSLTMPQLRIQEVGPVNRSSVSPFQLPGPANTKSRISRTSNGTIYRSARSSLVSPIDSDGASDFSMQAAHDAVSLLSQIELHSGSNDDLGARSSGMHHLAHHRGSSALLSLPGALASRSSVSIYSLAFDRRPTSAVQSHVPEEDFPGSPKRNAEENDGLFFWLSTPGTQAWKALAEN